MLKYRTSIYTRPRVPRRPTYRRASLLDLMRQERKLDARQQALDKIIADGLLYGTGVGIVHIDRMQIANLTQH